MISPILIFTAMLSLAYSVFQGNVGTAYRQRAQLLVFYFIFVAVGFVLMLEKREERKRRQIEAREDCITAPAAITRPAASTSAEQSSSTLKGNKGKRPWTVSPSSTQFGEVRAEIESTNCSYVWNCWHSS